MATTTLIDTEGPFLDQTKEVASFFLDLYLPPKPAADPQRSPYPGRQVERHGVVTQESQEVEGTASSAATAADLPSSLPLKTSQGAAPPPARVIAERLKVIGDSIDKKVQEDLQASIMELLKNQAVYQVGLPDFKMMCRTLLNRCSGYFSSGWEQVTVVYMGMGRLVHEIRAEDQEAASRIRENQVEGFVGQALKDLRLDQWIEQQGGLDRIAVPQEGQPCNIVPIEGTSVDK